MTRSGLGGYPVTLLVAGRRVVVVGGGHIGARKVRGLLDGEAVVHVVALRVDEEMRALADDGHVTLDERAFEPADLDGAWLVITATDDPATNRAVRDAAEDRRIWVNAADDPEHCTFILPAVVRRGDLLVTAGTGGRSPALTLWMKHRLEAEFGPEFEALLEVLAQAREAIRAEGRPTESVDWQSAIDAGMEAGILEMLGDGRVDEAKEVIAECLSSS